MQKLDKQKLIILVHNIMDPIHSDESRKNWLVDLKRSVPHPEPSGLIYWPENYGLGPEPDVEDIVDAALNYQPITLREEKSN